MRSLLSMNLPVLILCLAGCGGAGTEGRVTVHAVTGKITMAGGPVSGATVAFAPRDGQPTAMGRTDSQGIYHLTTYENQDGAALGKYAVVVSKRVVKQVESSGEEEGHSADGTGIVDGAHGGGKKGDDESGELLPAQFCSGSTTPLTATVKEGENSIDFSLE